MRGKHGEIKVNGGRKVTVVRDELNIKKEGFYAFTPFDRLDIHKKTVFKVGMATSTIDRRIDGHHTDYPNGVHLVSFLEDPPIPRKTRNTPKVTKRGHYLEIEQYIFDGIIYYGGKRLTSTTRNQGKTEWFYADVNAIHYAFLDAYETYGGEATYYHLNDLNKDAAKIEEKKPFFTGKIYFV
jgi:hypothetical protein